MLNETTWLPMLFFSGSHTGPGGPGEPDGQEDEFGLRLRDAINRRQDKPHEKDLALQHDAKGIGMDLSGSRST